PPPAVPAGRVQFLAGAMAAVLVLGGGGWLAGRWAHDRTPVRLPPVAAHAPVLDPASAEGWLFFDPFPWTECSIDGRPVGASPLVAHALAPGQHTLEYHGVDGRQGTTTFVIRAGRPTVVGPSTGRHGFFPC